MNEISRMIPNLFTDRQIFTTSSFENVINYHENSLVIDIS